MKWRFLYVGPALIALFFMSSVSLSSSVAGEVPHVIPNDLEASKLKNNMSISAATSGSFSQNNFTYLGVFKLDCSSIGDSCTFNLNDIAIANDGNLWVTDHVREYAVRKISIPTPLISTDYDALPGASTISGPLRFGGCPGPSTDISGVEDINGVPAGTCRDWYNVTGEYLPTFYRQPGATIEEIGPQATPFHPNKFGAYLFSLPLYWRQANNLGTQSLVTGFSRENGANGGFQGPALFAFDPDNPSSATPLLYYREIHPGCPYEGNCDFPGYESSDSWMGADWIQIGSAEVIVIAGVKAGSTCYGEAADCNNPCSVYKGYHGYPYTPKILFYNPSDLERVTNGELQPYQVLPYDEWVPIELWNQECPNVGGLTFDDTTNRMYLAERVTGDFGAGIIHVYQVNPGSSTTSTSRFPWPMFMPAIENGQ